MASPLPILLALAVATPALAQEADINPGLDAHGFKHAISDGDLLDFLSMWRAERQGRNAIGVDALFEYADNMLVLAEENQDGSITRTPLLDSLFALNLGLHYSPHERVGITLGMPLVFTSVGLNGPQGVGAGDLRLSVPVGLVLGRDGGNDGFGLSIVPFLDVPSGATGKNIGASNVTGGALIPFGYTIGDRASIFANVGFTWMQSTSTLNLEGGPQLLSAIGASVAFSERFGARLEANFNPVLRPNEIPFAEAPGEVMLSARYRSPFGLHATLGGSAGITRGVGAASFRIFAGVGYVFGKAQGDRDLDGLLDHVDECPDDPEIYNEWKDEDGCPDELAKLIIQVFDNDGEPVQGATIKDQGERRLGMTGPDGQLVIDKLIPDQTAILSAERARMDSGVSDPVDLVEGENIARVDMLWRPGRVRIVAIGPEGPLDDAVATFLGPTNRPPLPVDDGDVMAFLAAGEWNVFVSAPGLGAQRRELTIEPDDYSLVVIEFKLQKARVSIAKEKVELYEKVFFDNGKATIKPESFGLLDEVAAVLLTSPQIRKIELQGHTDSNGAEGYNLDLSQQRVDSVRAYLIDRGVAPERMVATGYGETRPIETNRTEQGRAANRRVEVSILEQDEAVAEPEQ